MAAMVQKPVEMKNDRVDTGGSVFCGSGSMKQPRHRKIVNTTCVMVAEKLCGY
jgi:hypothetical protein